MLTRARGTDSTTLLVTDQVEPSRSDGTLLMGADPHRRRARASTLTDDRNTRHDRPHRRRENASVTDASFDDA